MTIARSYRLGDLQLKIMKILWDRNRATVADVHDALGRDDHAHTTVATMLRKMEGRRLVRHLTVGRRFIYVPAVSPDEVTQSMADDLLDRLFEGSLTDMVSHLLSTRDVSREELRRLEKVIAERKVSGGCKPAGKFPTQILGGAKP
jgi:BlaI family penicillinase repressor